MFPAPAPLTRPQANICLLPFFLLLLLLLIVCFSSPVPLALSSSSLVSPSQNCHYDTRNYKKYKCHSDRHTHHLSHGHTHICIYTPSLLPSLRSILDRWLLVRLFSDQHAHTPIAHHEQHRKNHCEHTKGPTQIVRVRINRSQVFSSCGEAEAAVAVAGIGAGEGAAVVEDDVAEEDGLEGGHGVGEGGAVVQPLEVGGD